MKRLGGPATEWAVFLALLAIGAAGLWQGWKVFWFLTDDAFIAFRYVSNSRLGFGYVWNPPPFLPVEGYTSFLWVALLDIVWRLTGVEPPRAANWISLAFSYGTLVVTSVLLMRLNWPARLSAWRTAFLGLFLGFLLLNRSFLAWSSSGLETAMFCFWVALWVWAFVRIRSDTARVWLGVFIAGLIALTRPDGLLFCAASALIAVFLACRPGLEARKRLAIGCGLAPLAIVAAHLLWRRHIYGAWLPNTYYAKVVAISPLSGSLYLLSFILEYALWFAAIPVAWAIIFGIPKVIRGPRRADRFSMEDAVRVLVVGALLAHGACYTWIIGGDHFEYRVFNQLLPFLFIALVWAICRLKLRPAAGLGLAAGFVLLSLPVPWTHWFLTRNLNTRQETLLMRAAIEPAWPVTLRPYARVFDNVQFWLIGRLICVRHQEHKVFWKTMIEAYPSREEGSRLPGDGYPVHATSSVGVAGWVLPHVYIIDLHGLNDSVIARTPVDAGRAFAMAHAHEPPPGYVESFRPNVNFTPEGLRVQKRAEPLTSAEVMAIESFWRDKIARQRGESGPWAVPAGG